MWESVPRKVQIGAVALSIVLVTGLSWSVVARPSASVDADAPSTPMGFVLGTPTKVTVIGDSLTAGTPDGGNRSYNWTVELAKLMYERKTPIALNALGNFEGGYTHGGRDAPAFPVVAGEFTKPDSDAVIVFGGNDDVGGDVAVAAAATFAAAKERAPSARLFVVGPIWRDSNPPLELLAVRDQIQQAAVGAQATFIDPLAEDWYGRTTQNYFGQTTPFDGGHAYMAGLILPHLALVADEVSKR